MAKVNPIRFSTKYDDDESDLLYYGYRYYKASTGNWLTRDPIDEKGGINLYVFVKNQPPNLLDFCGLQGLGTIHPPLNPNSGQDIETHCKCKITCVDKEDLKRGISSAEQELENLSGKTFDTWVDFLNALNAAGIVQVGQTTGLLNGGLTGPGKNRLTVGQQCIVKYFESNDFTLKPGNSDHPPFTDSHGASQYINTWIEAEDNRLQNAAAELADAEKIEGCPTYAPKSYPSGR